MKRLLAALPLAVFAAIVVAGFLILQRGERAPVETGLVGSAAPSFALTSLDGAATISDDAFKGRAYLVNFFASWCAPCREEHAVLLELKNAGVPILGVAYKDAPAKTRALLALAGDPYETIGLDPDGRFALQLGISGVPETYVVGADGKLLHLERGVLTEAVVRNEILPALGLKAPTSPPPR